MAEDYIIIEGRSSTLEARVNTTMKELKINEPSKKYVLHGAPVKISKTSDGIGIVLIQAIVSTSILSNGL